MIRVMALIPTDPAADRESGETIGFKVRVSTPAGEEGSTMRNLFAGGFHLTQRIKVPGGIGMTQQGYRGEGSRTFWCHSATEKKSILRDAGEIPKRNH